MGTNDAPGKTDKLITNIATLEYHRNFNFYSVSLRHSSVLITPIFETRFDKKRLPEEIGEVADILETSIA